ncbi:MAG: cyclodeaminase/cyclohydrolase family protein [Candidatus Omnitrophica bacterium]|nr:cyclodeaminase/cyclohydrolase family protein [Candidatus Omnitrophota bacterium]MCM8802124.1 cyclodeaminase/cyclohydrolase family protein [Candidatus Omnitrophota bacterium]
MDCNFLNSSLKNYFDILSAKTPIPGGGSAVACLASLSSSLLNMVLNYTIGKKGYEEFQEELKKIKERNDEILKDCSNFIEEDSRIYKKIDEAIKKKKDTEEHLKSSANLHLKICNYMVEIVNFCDILVEKGNKNLISDTGIANIFAFGAFISGKINILINLKFLKDQELKKNIKQEIEILEKKIKDKSEKINKIVIEKMGV